MVDRKSCPLLKQFSNESRITVNSHFYGQDRGAFSARTTDKGSDAISEKIQSSPLIYKKEVQAKEKVVGPIPTIGSLAKGVKVC